MARIFTNKYNLPQSYVNAVKVDKHKVYGDISVTQLIDSAQIRVLKRQYDETIDVADMVWVLLGTATHTVLERSEQESIDVRTLLQASEILIESNDQGAQRAAEWIKKFTKEQFPNGINENVLLEYTMTTEFQGWDLSGTIDRFAIDSGLLEDYKTCSTYEYINPESRKKWYAQLNIYAHKLRKAGYKVNKAQIVAIFKNWNKAEQMRNRDYPPQQIMCLEIPLLDDKVVEEYINNRIKLHQGAEKGNVPDCTGKERWSKADMFAVKREGGKRALRTFDKEVMAKEYMRVNEGKGKPMQIEFRPGIDTRCESYCPVSLHCPQLKNKLNMIAEKELELNK